MKDKVELALFLSPLALGLIAIIIGLTMMVFPQRTECEKSGNVWLWREGVCISKEAVVK